LPTFIVVDGNNLIHHIYNIPNEHEYKGEYDRELITGLVDWGHKIGRMRVRIELCLDSGNERSCDESILAVFKPNNSSSLYEERSREIADDKVRQRVWIHLDLGQSCIVVTDDGNLANDIKESNVMVISLEDFTPYGGPGLPKFSMLEDELSSLDVATIPDDSPTAMKDAFSTAITSARKRVDDESVVHADVKIETSQDADFFASTFQFRSDPRKSKKIPYERDSGSDISYELSFESWKTDEAIRLLMKSFCDSHEGIYAELGLCVEDSDDIRVLSDLLIESCGSETQFLSKGTLYDRAVRFLLLENGGPIPLEDLANRLNARPRKVRRKLEGKLGIRTLKNSNIRTMRK
jgi:hypothetical protein